jgi:PAS domain S-box-containing protein
MKFFRDSSIQRKQTLIIMLTTTVALLLTCAALTVFEVITFQHQVTDDLSTYASIVGNNVSAALDFNDAGSAEQTLSALRAEPDVIGACVYTPNGTVFAQYDRANNGIVFHPPQKIRQAGHVFSNGRLSLFQPIKSDGQVIGTIYLESNARRLRSQLIQYALISTGVLLATLFISLLLSSRLQRLVSEPLLDLARTARNVAKNKNYSIRVQRRNADEIGALVDSFNDMLAQIQERDATLENRVAERTQELTRERNLLRALMDGSDDCIYFKDIESCFVRCSSKMAKLFGVGKIEELIGKRDGDFFTSEHAREALEDEQEIIRTGEPLVGKVEMETWRDGRVTWALTSKMPLRDEAGNIVGTFGISKNITAIKEAEEKLSQAHKQLVDASRQAGMAEVATSVLHNVGNVLNSVNVSSSLIADKMRHSKVANLAKAVALMRTHEKDFGSFFANDPKGKQLPDYLARLAAHLAQEQEEILHEVGSLVGNIIHIKEIVAMQQSYAKASGVIESVNVTELVEDALRMNTVAMTRHKVKIVRDFKAVPSVLTEKHKVLQILVNLIRNAKYACDDSGREDKQITLRVVNGEGRVKISVADNGVGIPEENLTRIFSHGFTTRKEGHGFGLHSGAIAARELGGCLLAFSEGPDCGAKFTLELPVKLPKANP